MERLFMRHALDLPHGRHEAYPENAICGVSLRTAQEITDAQAVKFLGNARCPDCFPGWTAHQGRTRG